MGQVPSSVSASRELWTDVSDLAYSVPPEFGADALLQVVESGAVAQRSVKLQLLNDALDLAKGVIPWI